MLLLFSYFGTLTSFPDWVRIPHRCYSHAVRNYLILNIIQAYYKQMCIHDVITRDANTMRYHANIVLNTNKN